MEPFRLIGQAVYTDDHRGRYVGRLEHSAPLRDQLTVTGEDDCLGRICRDVHRDLPTTVVIERFGDDLSRSWLVVHGRIPILRRLTATATADGNPQPPVAAQDAPTHCGDVGLRHATCSASPSPLTDW